MAMAKTVRWAILLVCQGVNHLNGNGSPFIENHQEPNFVVISGRENQETGYFCYFAVEFYWLCRFLI